MTCKGYLINQCFYTSSFCVLLLFSLSVVLFCDPMDCSPPGFSVYEISQSRIVEWVAISFSRGSSNPGIEPYFPALQAYSLPLSHLGSSTSAFSSVQFSHSVVSGSLQPPELQNARPLCPSSTPRLYLNSC